MAGARAVDPGHSQNSHGRSQVCGIAYTLTSEVMASTS